jgi:hypothetical protein
MWFKLILAVVAGAVAITFVAIRGPFSGGTDVAHEAVRLHLNFFGSKHLRIPSDYRQMAHANRRPGKDILAGRKSVLAVLVCR